jgi:thymidylate synthase (FAD)
MIPQEDYESEPIKVLDQGYVRLVEGWGSDAKIIRAARQSTNKGFLGWGLKCSACGDFFEGEVRDCPNPNLKPGHPLVNSRGGHRFDTPGDEKLLKFLWDSNHSGPFEHAGMTIEVKAPIMVFREFHRHRTMSYSEMSARYVPLPDEDYVPSMERLMSVATQSTNRQATGTGAVLTEQTAGDWLASLEHLYEQAQHVYEQGLKYGIAKELARLPVSVARYSRMWATANLLNWTKFLKLRCDTKAQYEIRQVAQAVVEIMKGRFPRTYDVAKGFGGFT